MQGKIDVSLTHNLFSNLAIEFESLIEEKPNVVVAGNDPFTSKNQSHLKN